MFKKVEETLGVSGKFTSAKKLSQFLPFTQSKKCIVFPKGQLPYQPSFLIVKSGSFKALS